MLSVDVYSISGQSTCMNLSVLNKSLSGLQKLYQPYQAIRRAGCVPQPRKEAASRGSRLQRSGPKGSTPTSCVTVAPGTATRCAVRSLQKVDAAMLVALRSSCLYPLAARTSARSCRSERPSNERYRYGPNTCHGSSIHLHLSRSRRRRAKLRRSCFEAALELHRSCKRK